MATLTEAQFQQLLQTITANANVPVQPPQNAPAAAAPRNDPAALGPMAPCTLGTNKMTKLTKFEEWLEEAENRMEYIGNQDDKDKIILLKSWGGSELNEFIKTCVTIVTVPQAATADTAAVEVDTYAEVVEKIKVELRKLVNRTMAMHDLYNTKQGTRSWMDYFHELEKKARVLDFDRRPYTTDEAIKDAAIRGMSDGKLSEKALAEDLSKDDVLKLGQAREAGKQDVSHLRENSVPVRRLNVNKELEDMNSNELEEVLEAVRIMKIRKAGRYSGSRKEKDEDNDNLCSRCNYKHETGKCPANDAECYRCGGKNHLSRACKTDLSKRKSSNVKFISKEEESYLTNRRDPEHNTKKDTKIIQKMINPETNLNVPIKIGKNKAITMFIDLGCGHTIIPPEYYTKDMGDLEEEDTNFRNWGSKQLLKVKGMVKTKLTTNRGAEKETKVYVVEGCHAEPLLGYDDADNLGFIHIDKEGRPPTDDEIKNKQTVKKVSKEEGKYSEADTKPKEQNKSIPEKIRCNLDVTVSTHPEEEIQIPAEEIQKVHDLVEQYQGSVFDENKVGKINTAPVHLEYADGFKPQQPKFRNTPIHYKEPVSKLLHFLREQKVIKDVDPRKPYDCIMNTVITDKKG